MKEIKIIEKGDKQLGIRLPLEIYKQLQALSKDHKTSIQEIIRYIIQEEIKNYK